MLELAREIERYPARPEPYLILADVLQSEGDPRGRLILLHHHLSAHSEDQNAADELASTLAEHEELLLGSLTRVQSEMSIDWALGFVRALRLEAASVEQMLADLELALASPSLRFVHTIELGVQERLTPTGKAEGYGRVAAKLIELGPRSIHRIQLGQPGDYAVSPALRAAFAGLSADRDPRELCQEIKEGVAQCKRLKVKFDAATLPELQPTDPDSAFELDAQQLLLGLKGELDKGKPIGIVNSMLRLFSADSLDRFAAGLVAQFEALGASSSNYAQLWAIEAAGALGGQHTVVAIADILQQDEWSLERFLRGLEILAKIGSSLAVDELYHLGLDSDGERKDAVKATLDRCAKANRRDLQTILDQFSPAQVDASLRRRLDLRFHRRLEDLMLSGHRIALRDFRNNLLEEPARLTQAATLLWAAFDPEGALVRPFRISAAGELIGLADAEKMAIAEDLVIGVVHPAELDESTRASWQEVLRRKGMEQVPPQLSRPVYRLSRRELAAGQIERFFDHFVDTSAAAHALNVRGWYLGTKHFARQDLTARIVGPTVDFGLPLDQVHPVIISEVLWDLETAMRPVPRSLRCASCSKPIEEGALRVGIYASDRHRGTATAWVHFACHRSWGALESIEALQQELS